MLTAGLTTSPTAAAAPQPAEQTHTIRLVAKSNNPAAIVDVQWQIDGAHESSGLARLAHGSWTKTFTVQSTSSGALSVSTFVFNEPDPYTGAFPYSHAHVAQQIVLDGVLMANSWTGGVKAQARGAYRSGPNAPDPHALEPAHPGSPARYRSSTAADSQVSYQVDDNNHANRLDVTYSTGPETGGGNLYDVLMPWHKTLTMQACAAGVSGSSTSSSYPRTRVTAKTYVEGTLIAADDEGGYHAITRADLNLDYGCNQD